MKNYTLQYFTYLFLIVIGLQLNACKHDEDFIDLSDRFTSKGEVIFSETIYETADVFRGGRLYGKWWEVKSISAPTVSNPIWEEIVTAIPSAASNGNDGSQWRCNECHGWDYKGVNGEYAQGSSHFTGIRSFDNSNPAFNPEHIFYIISNGMVDYGSKQGIPHTFVGTNFMSATDVYDLTKFIFEVARIDNASASLGDVTRGEAVFYNIPNALDPSWNCATAGCHSQSSTNTPTLDDITGLAKDNPQEFLHKVRFGSPSSLMPFGMSTIQAQDVLAYITTDATPVEIPSSNFDQAEYDSKSREDVVLGGKIYDKWWRSSIAVTEPTTSHILWPVSNTSVTGSDTWRCSLCHGWDYRGADGAFASGKYASGIQGIVDTTNFTMRYTSAAAVYAFLKEDVNHGFDNKYTDEEYYALTKFIISMRDEINAKQSSSDFIDDITLLASNGADVSNGKTLFDTANITTCGDSSCHGEDGKLIDLHDSNEDIFPNKYVHNIAQENPWEFMHKIRFGEPNYTEMPSLYDANEASITTITAAADILAYSQNKLVPNINRAGLLYDTWWNVNGVLDSTVPTSRNASWIANAGTTDITSVSNATTWRCKECHGWDYQGVDGAYNYTNKHYSGIRGFIPILNSVYKDKNYLINAIKNGVANSELDDHDFGRFLSEEDISVLADFILDGEQGIAKTSNEYNDYLNNGSPANGLLIYQSNNLGSCQSCHGVKGMSVPTVDIGVVANTNPQEFLHKIRFGQPGSIMLPSKVGFMGLSVKEASDVLAYVKLMSTDSELEQKIRYSNANTIRGGRLYDNWLKELQADKDINVPSIMNPLWEARSVDIEDFPSTWLETQKIMASWRCQSCHAWDYKGIGYVSGAPDTKGADNLLYKIKLRRNITFVNKDAELKQFLYHWIKTGLGTAHNFGETSDYMPSSLTDEDLWDLIKFLLEEGVIDTGTNISSSGEVLDGDIANGKALYVGTLDGDINCVACHGTDGAALMPEGQGASGNVLDIIQISSANNNPWKLLHKIRFGEPGTSMPAMLNTNSLSNSDAFDILAYMQQQYNAR